VGKRHVKRGYASAISAHTCIFLRHMRALCAVSVEEIVCKLSININYSKPIDNKIESDVWYNSGL
jgi:hypothetical protein